MLPRPLLAHSRGYCPCTKQYGPRGEAVTAPLHAHRTSARVLHSTAPPGIISSQGAVSQLGRSSLLLCRLQTCKAEKLPDLELFPSLAQLRPSLSRHTTAEQLSTAPPAPHLQSSPPNPMPDHPGGRSVLCPLAATSSHRAGMIKQHAVVVEMRGHLGRKLKTHPAKAG